MNFTSFRPVVASFAAGLALACSLAMAQEEEKVLNIYNWSDYIAEDTLKNFEKETGIKVRYDNFDNNEIVHAKLVAGKTGYDLVVPSSNWAKLQVDGGLLRKIDKGQLSNYKNLDPALQAQLAAPAGPAPRPLCFPAQSNFSGVKHPLALIAQAQSLGWRVLLDAAAYVPTNALDLQQLSPDFVVMSFYKMFGYPTGVGCLLVRNETLARLRRPWFGGGTVNFATVQGRSEHEGKELGAGPGANVMGGTLISLAWLANRLIANGKMLKEGETVLTGSVHPPQFLPGPGKAKSEFKGIGSAEITVK